MMNGRCCDKCSPGTYLREYCTESTKTVCNPCPENHFMDIYHAFDRCKPCQSCSQEHALKCVATRNANCSCHPGFLCSNNICSTCVENPCAIFQKAKRTESPSGEGMIKYSYNCEDLCTDMHFFDEKEKSCKPRTQCGALGRAEWFPGNKTHNSVCERLVERDVRDSIHVILGVCVVLLSLNLLLFLSYTCIKNLMKHRASHTPSPEVSPNICDFHLPKEESGLMFIKVDAEEYSYSDQLDLEKISVK
ncbi:tumor necrosis factor receptor superfamily member 18 isoform 2-T2 [Pholidichthys leucotaenia]